MRALTASLTVLLPLLILTSGAAAFSDLCHVASPKGGSGTARIVIASLMGMLSSVSAHNNPNSWTGGCQLHTSVPPPSTSFTLRVCLTGRNKHDHHSSRT